MDVGRGVDIGRRSDVGGRVDLGRRVDLGLRADVGGRVDVGTPIVDDGTGSVGRFSCSCLQLEPGDFSFLFSLARSFAAIVINTIPTMHKIIPTANTTSVMTLSFDSVLPRFTLASFNMSSFSFSLLEVCMISCR